MSKLLSVIIPSYNMEKYLDNCIESLVKSKYIDELEILIVNDGSKDATHDIGARWEKEFPNSIQLIDKENGGHGSAINLGSGICKGKYFKILDADDWVDTSQLDLLVEKLAEVEVDCVICNYTRVYEATKTKELNDSVGDFETGKVIPFEEYIKSKTLQLHMLSYKTQTYRDAGIKVREKCFFEDSQFCLYAYNVVKDVVCYPFDVYQYRLQREGQSMSAQGFLKHLDDHRNVVFDLCEFYKENDMDNEATKKALRDQIGGHIQLHYTFIAKYASKEQLKETKKFNQQIKTSYKEIYDSMTKQRGGKLLNVLNFGCYPLLKLARKIFVK